MTPQEVQKKTAIHEVCSFGYVVVMCDDKPEEPVLYRGPNAAEKLLESLAKEEWIREKLRNPKEMKYTEKAKMHFEKAKKCHICKQNLLQYGRRVKKAWDKEGNYLGKAHIGCGKYAKGGKPGSHRPTVYTVRTQ